MNKSNKKIYINNMISYEDVNLIYRLLVIKYRDLFNDKEAYDMAIRLYDYGIRYFMFFDERIDVNEIVYYCLNREKVVDICSRIKTSYSYDNKDIEDNKKCEVIKFDSIKKLRK